MAIIDTIKALGVKAYQALQQAEENKKKRQQAAPAFTPEKSVLSMGAVPINQPLTTPLGRPIQKAPLSSPAIQAQGKQGGISIRGGQKEAPTSVSVGAVLKEVPGVAGMMAKDIAQGFARSLAGVGVSAVDVFKKDKIGKIDAPSVDDSSYAAALHRTVFGEKEPIKTLATQTAESEQNLQKYGLGKAALPAALLGVAGMAALDVYPGGSAGKHLAKHTVKELAEETTEQGIRRILKTQNLADDVIEPLVPFLMKEKSEVGVRQILKNVPLPKATKVASQVIPEGQMVPKSPTITSSTIKSAFSPEDLAGIKTRIANSASFDVQSGIKKGVIPRTDIYREGNILTREFAQGRVDDIAQKLDMARPGLGDTFRKSVDLDSVTMNSNVPEGLVLKAQSLLDDSFKQVKVIAPQPTTLKTNVQLSKFELPKDGQENLARIMKENQGFVAERRGVQSFADTERMAKSLQSSIKLKKGSALNAEELQSLGNTVASLQLKVSDVAQRVAGGANDTATLIELAKAKEELTFALASYSGATAEAGRSLSILRNLRKAEMSGDTEFMRKVMKIGSDKMSTEEIARKLVAMGDDNVAKMKFMRDLAKVRMTDKMHEVWLNSILSNPVTHAVNITGNTLNALTMVPVRAVQAAIQVPGKRKVFMGEVPQQIVGFAEGIVPGVQKALYAFRNGISFEDMSKLDINYLPAIKGAKGEVLRTPTRALLAADEFFKTIIGTSEMRALAYRGARKEGLKGTSAFRRMHELIDNPTKQMYEAVDFKKLRGTFQEPLGQAGQAILKFRNRFPGAKYVIPFIKTPTNIVKEAGRISPLGFASIANKIAKKGYAALPEGQMTEDIAKAMMGSAMTLPIVIGALNGDITGAAPKNTSERDAFYRQGKMPYSIKIGDKWVSYRRIEPVATVIGMVADFTQITDEEGISKAAQDIAGIMGRNLTDKTFLSGISNAIDALTDPTKRENWVENTVAGFVPFSGTLRFATQISDPTVRDIKGPIDAVKAEIPFLSKTLRPKLNAFGEEVKKEISQITTPVAVKSAEEPMIEKELREASVLIGFPSKTVEGIELTDDQYHKLVATSGPIIKEILTDIVETPAWKDMNDQEKSDLVTNVSSKVRTRTREKLFPAYTMASEIRKRLKDERGLSNKDANDLTEKIIRDMEKDQ